MYDVNILVNGSRCKQYTHEGKIFVEAKEGSEYVIEVKNNTWQRILAVCSVDGLDILDGKPAKENNPGYVISGYNTGKFDGFRVSNEKVAKFLFDYKGASYAASKESGAERNVGVIGLRLFQEKVKPPTIIQEVHHHHNIHRPWWNDTIYGGRLGDMTPTIWCDTTLSCGMNESSTTDMNGGGNALYERAPEMTKYSCDHVPTKGSTKGSPFGAKTRSAPLARGLMGDSPLRSMNNTVKCSGISATEPTPRGFDIGTKWGEAKESRVIEVEFERGLLALTTNIYYASRQSLLEMGVPLGNEKQVSFPEPFVDSKYAKPPKNWVG